MRWTFLLVLIGVIVAAVAVAYDRMIVVDWVGGYEVEVHVQRTGAGPIAGASAAVLFRPEWDFAKGDPRCIAELLEPVDIVRQQGFTAHVTSGGKDSGWGRRLSYVRQEVLVVKVDYRDGSSRLVAAEIPGSGEQRTLLLEVP